MESGMVDRPPTAWGSLPLEEPDPSYQGAIPGYRVRLGLLDVKVAVQK